MYGVTEAGETISFTVSFGMPIISVDPTSLTYNLDAGEYDVQMVTISNVGEPETVLDYQAIVTTEETYLNPQGGPDGLN